MMCARTTWVLPIALTLILAVGACKKSTSKEDVPASSMEQGDDESPAPARPPARATTETPPAAPAPAEQAEQNTTAVQGAPAEAAPTAAPPTAPVPPVVVAQAPTVPRTPLLDPRLMLTLKDVQDLAKGKVEFRRVALQGVPTDDDTDAILYEPEKGTSYGAALQVFRARTPEAARERFAAMLASYPSATEIPPVAGKTFFAYWEEILYVGFLIPTRNMVVVMSCGRKFCDSDGLYELARKVGARTNG
jgi:hypothetical protein